MRRCSAAHICLQGNSPTNLMLSYRPSAAASGRLQVIQVPAAGEGREGAREKLEGFGQVLEEALVIANKNFGLPAS